MCNRRNKPIWQATVLLALVGGLGYTFYLYNSATMDLDASRSEADKYLHQRESLSSQLQVVYEHRARLERSLQKEKADHKNVKLDFSKKQNAFLLNVTRSKHEAMNRFNSLETQYNMLKAQAKELQTDYSRLQQQYSRLSSEHGLVVNEQKRNFQVYKEQKANEILSLTGMTGICTLDHPEKFKEIEVCPPPFGEEQQYTNLSSSTALAASQKYQEKLRMLQEEFATYKYMYFLEITVYQAAKQSLQSEIQETSELKKVRRDAKNVRKEWNEDEQSLGEQKIDSNQNSLPVVQPEIVGDRQDQRRSQYDALSREEINRQVAELRNHREQAAQPQLKVASMLPVQRQDELQQKADNDEEDVGETKSQQEADPDEEDPDEDKVPEQQFHDRSLKAEAGAAVQ
ncbi:Golgi integral membrane protein 4, partial [Acropora cervicornis]